MTVITITSFSFTLFWLLNLLNSVESFNKRDINGSKVDHIVKRSQFPDGFLFGVSTASYQIEGAILEDGKGISNWDRFVHTKGRIANGETGDIAADHYNRYMEDIKIIHSLGVDSYRFSISWSRILPKGKFGDVNPPGIMFYNNIIDNLLLRGIKPFVTIHHYDFPQDLQDRFGGWLSRRMLEEFVYFAETCFKSFGDRVKHWMTLNEPNIFVEMAYMRGLYPPGRCSPPFGNCSAGNSDTEPLIAMHNLLLGHAKAVKLYRDRFQPEHGGIIGIVINAFMYEPLNENKFDKKATSRAFDFNVAWVFDPLVFGDYPQEMHRYLGSALPKFTPEETKLIKNSTDFLGINHYTTLYVNDCIHSNCSPISDRAIMGFLEATTSRNGVSIGEPTGMSRMFVVPRGMEAVVNYARKRYNNMPMYITENGYSSPRQIVNREELRNDISRINFHKSYIASLARAVKNGADVRGYFIWTLMDDFEWSNGFAARFGLYSVDPVTQDRRPKLSANWYRAFLKEH